jgi:hypothetical protein
MATGSLIVYKKNMNIQVGLKIGKGVYAMEEFKIICFDRRCKK